MKLPELDIKKLLIYVIFWAVSFYAALEVFSRADEYRLIDVIYTFLFLLPFVIVVSIHSYHFIPNYLAKSRFWLYGISLLFLFGFAFSAYNFNFLILSEWLFPGYYLVGVHAPHEILGFTILFLLISSSLEFSRNWFEGLRAKSRVSELETEKVASELKALRAQVNPHFLFNSLNTIYSEAIKKSEKAPRLILQLSEMLRYVVDKMDEDLVPLKEEVDYLKNYFLLHKERLNNPARAKFTFDLKLTDQQIAPLLLINFIENSFKHADLSGPDSFISIQLSVEQNRLKLKSQNTFYEDADNSVINTTGTGIQNAKRRLQLVYPKRHSLSTSKDKNIYTLELTMELD